MATRLKKKTKPIGETKQCSKCGKDKALVNFYVSNSDMFADKKVPFCKDCCLAEVDPFKVESVIAMLQMMDKPFIHDVWYPTLAKNEESAFGNYMRQINSLGQYKNLTHKNSVFKGDKKVEILRDSDDEEVNEMMTETQNKIVYDKNLKLKWKGHPKEDVLRLEKFYDEMMSTHEIHTPQHRELLKFMCKLNLKLDKCLDEDDAQGFSKYYQQYSKLLETSGFRPIDKSASDDSKGVRTFSQIFQEVEKRGHIKPVPVTEEQDIVDKTIMYMLNYNLKLLNMQQLTEPPEDTPMVTEIEVDEEDLEVV